MDTIELEHALTKAFAVTGASTLAWPDPHPDRDPLEEEYSRILDPAKYRIVGARADAWIAALTTLQLADAEDVPEPNAAWEEPPPVTLTRAVRLRPRAPGAAPLLLGYDAVLGGVADTDLLVGAGDPAVQLQLIPNCGCDACDMGSEFLLEHLDRFVIDVVTGLADVSTARSTTIGGAPW